jgi:hypothetical protein
VFSRRRLRRTQPGCYRFGEDRIWRQRRDRNVGQDTRTKQLIALEWKAAEHRCVALGRAITIVILSALLASAISALALAQSQPTFYLHSNYALDETAPTSATPHVLRLTTTQHYVWRTTPFATGVSFQAGTWSVNLWMNITQRPTQCKVELGVVTESGAFTSTNSSYTPPIESATARLYQVAISAATLVVNARESLGIALLRQWQNGSYSPIALIFLDSSSMGSSVSGPPVTGATTTLTTTQAATQQQTTTEHSTTLVTHTTTMEQSTASITHTTIPTTTKATASPGVGFAFAVIAIGAGIASAGGGLAVAATGQPRSEVFTYGGYYYCRKHRVPLWYIHGSLWCPVEQRYLTA